VQQIKTGITGIGSYLPAKILTNFDIEKIVDTSDEWIFTRTGIKERHVVEDESTFDMSLKAVKEALEVAGVPGSQINLVIVATITPDHLITPSTACQIQAAIGAKNAGAFDISAGCSGFLYALSMARQFIKSGKGEHALVVGAETLTKITNWQDRETCILFGDAAGAVVVSKVDEEGLFKFILGSDGSGGELLTLPAGGVKMPFSKEALSENQQYIHMQGNKVFKFATRIIDVALKDVLERNNFSLEKVNYFALHQANIRILKSWAHKYKVPMEKVLTNIEYCGNTSAASVPVLLNEYYKNGTIKKGDYIASMAFGAGLTWAGGLIKWII